ncbi:MAG: carboxypeptidase regulatory-like domain-containing protein [Cyclobacteriaceae bacterium]|nr:carboxypeptidase regulatory-like domain-containing protein [Cyclobacteriaceae bacterium]
MMQKLVPALAGVLLLLHGSLLAQVNGTLTAPNGKPAADAEVFINRSSYRAVTDDFGQFTLADVPPGFHEIVAYKKGFSLYRAPMRVQPGRSYTLNLKFADTEGKARGKSTPETESAFAQALLGPEGLLLFNPETTVKAESSGGKFRVLSSPVIVEYPNAGYRITAYFNPHIFQDITEAAYCYQEYQGSNVNQNMAIERTRLAMYQGSLRHWLTAVVAGKAAEDGFQHNAGDGTPVSPPTATPSATEGYYRIPINGPLNVRYKDLPKSLLSAAAPADVNTNGILINPRSIAIDGDMNKSGLAYQLPLDYRPIQDIESTYAEALRYFYEKIYVHTDKPYYYPGEPLWMKAYVNYYNPGWRDSLSDVLYVEVINGKREVQVERILRIENGVSQGDFILPDSIEEGMYYLRAYTNLRRNFGDSGLFTRPLQILRRTDRIDPAYQQPSQAAVGLAVQTDKGRYRVRDKITLQLKLDEALVASGANLSVAVTDAAQVIAIPAKQTILDVLPIDPNEIPRIDELNRRIERGVSFFGQFVNNKGEPEKTQLSFIQWKTGDVLSVETDDEGMFWQTGLQFTDSAMFSYKSDKAKGRAYGSVKVLPREVPALEGVAPPLAPIVRAGTAQRIFSEYEVPKDSKLLEEVEIVGRRPEDTEFERSKRRPYGRADYVLTSKNLNVNSGNLLLALVGKVPGLVVNPTQGTVYFGRAYGSSVTQPPNPLVTINDVPMAGDAGTILQTIDFNIIESIEFTKRLNVLYGSQGGNGVISVYTKSGASVDDTDPNFQTIKLPGFSKTRKFQAPEYDKPQDNSQADYRSTLYWNPEVIVDAAAGVATVTFFASDLAGDYRVVVEGVAGNGKPLRAEALVSVEEKP